MPVKRREPLNRERVVRAAMELADAGGIATLSMRRLGQAVGVEAMSLYNHVAGKDDLIDGMVDAVFAEIALPAAGDDWRKAMRERAVSTREALLRHPWAGGLMNSRAAPGPATLRHLDAVLGCLRGAGFSVARAAHALSLIDSYVYGFVQQEASLPFDAEASAEVTGAILARFDPEQHPFLSEMATEHVMRPGYDYGDEFELGLDVILDGIEGSTRWR
jgi:AcrR family transcriptional regulator